MSLLKWHVNSSSNFAFFITMTHNFSVSFKVIPFLLWTKGSHQSLNFDTFKCSSGKCQISQVFLQTTSQFFFKMFITVSWKINPLYFYSSNNIYFGHKEPITTNFLHFRVHRSKLVKFLMSILKRQVSSSSILYHSSLSWHTTPL